MDMTCIRGLDKKLYLKARAQAIQQGITIGQWLNLAMKLKLKIK